MKRQVFIMVFCCFLAINMQAQATDTLSIQSRDSLTLSDISTPRKKSYWRATGEVVGLNIGLWAFDRFALKGHYAYISWETIKANFKNGFEWDNDHLNTNLFAHPYNGSLYFNAGRSNGFNFWQSELFAIGGSAMWEMFMEKEYPSTNDIIATPIGGAALGEVFYRTSDMLLDDRTSGGERFGRELAAFVISPMRGFTRIVTGQAWKKQSVSGRDFGKPDYSLKFSIGTRMLTFHDDRNMVKMGATARLDFEYGDRFVSSNRPYDYFTFQMDLNLLETQPVLNRIEIIGRLLSKEMLNTSKINLSVGLYQHFDFFDSDTISTNYVSGDFKPCAVPYKLGTPASVGGGALFRYAPTDKNTLTAFVHANGVILGGILSDYYRYYHRNYNWASGFAIKLGIDYSFNDKLLVSLRNQFYKFYTWSSWDSSDDWSLTPGGKPVNVQGDNSIGKFNHLEGQINYRLWKNLYVGAGIDWYHRITEYGTYKYFDYGGTTVGMSSYFITSHQLSCQLKLTYKL